MKKIKFYTLLYIDSKNKNLSHNGISGDFSSQMKTFIKCCEVLNHSLKFFENQEVNVLTNNKNYINNISKELNCIEIDFNLNIPKDIKFFSAHHKIDVFNYFSTLSNNDYSILIDNDVVCINKMPINLANLVFNNIPIYYDITNQVYPAYGRDTIIKDKEKLMDKKSIGMWAGGEFIGGDNVFFKTLYNEIKLLYKNYLNSYKKFHHQGDEMLTSCALEKIIYTQNVSDVGRFGCIERYWSAKTLHIQKKIKLYKILFSFTFTGR